ncbi:MAG: tyrosine-type recombinase/integrase [Opitutaceae bacterium]|nr:tyrosine-type recombinase/integrase [Opitutaceae bacterium]
MAGSRSLTPREERLLVRCSRKLNPRDRALICAQLFLGFRISEILALTIGHVMHQGRIRPLVALAPRFLKGGHGPTRVIPVGPELHRALDCYLRARTRKENLQPSEPLFLSRESGAGGAAKALHRSTAERIIKRALLNICMEPHGLSTHTLRKSWAVRLFVESGHDIMLVRDGLGHRSVTATQRYLPVRGTQLAGFILKSDWTRPSKRESELPAGAF